MKMTNDIVVIADTQVTPSAPLEHIHAVARYIWIRYCSHRRPLGL